MLSYQHAYHAGNPADVLKHALWAEVLTALLAKPKPLRIYDTHAGRGAYPVAANETQRGAEFEHGLGAMPLAEIPGAYGSVVRALNPDGHLAVIPGSPAVARHLLREGDQLHLCELHPGEYDHLQAWVRHQRGVHPQLQNGFIVVPPLLRQGQRDVVMIDPSYEQASEYDAVAACVAACLKANPQATVVVWLPLLSEGKGKGKHQSVIDAVKALGVQATFLAQWQWGELKPGHALVGTAMLVVNLPFKLEETLPPLVQALASRLAIPRKAQTYTLLVPRR